MLPIILSQHLGRFKIYLLNNLQVLKRGDHWYYPNLKLIRYNEGGR